MLLSVSFAGCVDPAFDVELVREFRNVRTISDPAKLAALATRSELVSVRSAAISQIDDPTVLMQVATEDELWQLRLAAASALPDQRMMTEIAMSDQAWRFRIVAVPLLTDQTVLTRVALLDESWQVRAAAVPLVLDQSVLIDVATWDKSGRVRTAAVAKVTDQQALTRLLTSETWANNDRWTEHSSAVDNLTDPELLAHVAVHGTDWSVRSSATRRVTDLAVLAEVAMTHGKGRPHADDGFSICGTSSRGPWRATSIATSMLSDQGTLEQIAMDSDCEDARWHAVVRLENEKVLRSIAANAEELSRISDAATRRLDAIKAPTNPAGGLSG